MDCWCGRGIAGSGGDTARIAQIFELFERVVFLAQSVARL